MSWNEEYLNNLPTIDSCNVVVKACCDCEFMMRYQNNRYKTFGDNRDFEKQVWNSKICDLHKKEMKEKLLKYMESLIK